MKTQTYTGALVAVECCSCHMYFGLTQDFYKARRHDHDWWYCPVGHPQHFTAKSEAEKLQDELDLERRRVGYLTNSRDQAIAAADHQAARANGYKGALTKTKKRIAKGVCPNCNRHFADVERHMASKHPEAL